MGAAYFIVLDNNEPGFDTFVDGKSVARGRDDLNAITKTLGLKGIDHFTSFAGLAEEFEIPEEFRKSPWFAPREGLDWIAAIRQHIDADHTSIKDANGLLADLQQYEQVLQRADAIGAKWHFEMDI